MSVRILQGDCRAVMATLDESSVDAIVCDPPYELGFMGKGWDSTGVANDPETWRQALRVLKPGGHLLAFSGTRTYHRMVCAIEDAGFEIRDQIGWLYGSGFPKSLDVSKAIDKAAGAARPVVGFDSVAAKRTAAVGTNTFGDYKGQSGAITSAASAASAAWDGWGTALKPAWEPIVLARKPMRGTVAANVLAHGTGALNIDGCRIETADDLNGGAYAAEGGRSISSALHAGSGMNQPGKTAGREYVQPAGRWPANILHDGSEEVLAAFPAAPGQQADISTTAPSPKTSGIYGRMNREGEASADSENTGAVGFKMKPGARRGDAGSAARFFYCAKADRADRNEGLQDPGPQSAAGRMPHDAEAVERAKRGNHHPTVKPTDLMRWLCRLITPPGGLVLDPFMGSGSTLKAAELEGFSAIGIELDPAYIEIAKRRIAADAPLFAEVTT
jgi:DNA modification methylase